MKKKGLFIGLASFVILIAYVIFSQLFIYVFLKSYSSPINVIEENPNFKNVEILDVLESNGVAQIICKEDTAIKSQFAMKNSKGWYLATNQLGFYNFVKLGNNYMITYDKSHGKHIICLDETLQENNDISPVDNLGSNFEYFEIQNGGYTIKTWFLVLNDLPDNYQITFGDEIIAIS